MDEQMINAMKLWLKENLIVEVEYCDSYSSNNDVYVKLRFYGDESEFTSDRVGIPSCDEK